MFDEHAAKKKGRGRPKSGSKHRLKQQTNQKLGQKHIRDSEEQQRAAACAKLEKEEVKGLRRVPCRRSLRAGHTGVQTCTRGGTRSPVQVRPVISVLVLVLVFGRGGTAGVWMQQLRVFRGKRRVRRAGGA